MKRKRAVARRQIGLGLFLTMAFVPSVSAQFRGDAVVGEPFGVAKLEVRLPEGQYSPVLGVEGLKISERDGRVLYPAVKRREIPGLVQEIPGMVTERMGGRGRRIGRIIGSFLDRPPTAIVYFLFRGSEPLELSVQSTRLHEIKMLPRQNEQLHEKLFEQWWNQYTDQPGLLENRDDYPPVVQTYTTGTLARRFGLEPPAESKPLLFSAPLNEQINLTLATERLKIEFERRRLSDRPELQEPADRSLPTAIPKTSAPVPEVAKDVPVEAMAMRVPPECAYIRFGSFGNFLWLQDTLKKWGGDVQNLLALRGLDYGMTNRIEEQIVLKQSALARLLGPTVIEDVAIVATDLYFQDGGSFGLLFHSKNNLVLGADFKRQRAERLEADEEVTEKTVQIAGHDVSLLSTPDHRVRSFYAVHGMFHFVTRSRYLMQRFLEVGDQDESSLGATAAFRHARQLMPPDRDDTVFVYMPEPFFDNLVSPRYRIETRRRLRAIADIELVKLARVAARGEGVPSDSIETLIDRGFLPPGFGTRPDGSEAVLTENGVADSLRGHRGSLVPIPDVPVENATRSEVSDYRDFVDFYERNWGNLDPVVVAIQRSSAEKKIEKVAVHARMTPFSTSNFQKLQETFGPADRLQLAPLPDDLASFEAILTEQTIFGGLRDVKPPTARPGAESLLGGLFRNFLVGYVGADGPLGPLRFLNFGLFSRTDPAGYAQSALGAWRLYAGDFTLFSFQQQVLAEVAPQLRYVEAETPAQLRLDVGDITQAEITPKLNDLGYARTADTSRGNLRLLHALNQQLNVPLADCLDVAEDLLDADLVCPLGGGYELQRSDSGILWWTSTALEGSPPSGFLSETAPQGFVAPPLNWFRGLDAEMRILPDTLELRAEVLMRELD